MEVQIRDILENFPDLLSLARGEKLSQVRGIQTGSTASKESLVFISNSQQLEEATRGSARVWVVDQSALERVPAHVDTVLVSPNPYLAMALIAKRFFPQTRGHQIHRDGPKIHPTAQISERARIGRDCIVGPGAVIGDDCVLGNRVIIGGNSVLEPGVTIGDETHVHPLVFIGHSCQVGSRCEIQPQSSIGTEGFGYAHDKAFNHYRITHYGRVIIEDDVHIGSGVNIDKGTFADSRIGAGTKIDNHCHFGHNIQIGRNCIITAGMITAGSTTIGNNCVFGGRVSIKGHLSLADGCQVAALSAVGKTVSKPGEYGGVHLLPIKQEMRIRAAMRELPDIIKQVRKLIKHLALDTESNLEAKETDSL